MKIKSYKINEKFRSIYEEIKVISSEVINLDVINAISYFKIISFFFKKLKGWINVRQHSYNLFSLVK